MDRARMTDYKPEALDQLCLTGAVGWGRLSPPDEQLFPERLFVSCHEQLFAVNPARRARGERVFD